MQAFLALLLCALLFMSGASLYWMLGFDFLAIVNVYVYVGALAILFLFIQMLLEASATALWAFRRGMSSLYFFLVVAVTGYDFVLFKESSFSFIPLKTHLESLSSISYALYIRYADFLILNSLVLTLALFGALVHAHHRYCECY